MMDFTFEGKRQDETVETVVKTHPFVLFEPGLQAILVMAIPFDVFLFYGATGFFTLSFFVCLVSAFAIFSRQFYDFAASVFVITDKRVIYLEQDGFFKRRVIETNYDKIQDVASHTKGAMRTMLDFGNIEIRTAGASLGSEIIIKNIPHPYRIQQEISKRVGE